MPRLTYAAATVSDHATPHQALQLVQQHGWCVVSGVPCDSDNRSLSALGTWFGRVSMQGTAKGQPNLEGNGINRVQVLATPLHDRVGNPVLSTVADTFGLHSDDSYNPEPARYVLMHCWRADVAGGGVSWISDIHQVVEGLPTALVQRLTHTLYPTPYGVAPVLARGTAGQWFVRFNQRDMLGYASLHGGELNTQQRSDLSTLEAAAMAVRQEVLLQTGDCIVADNHRVLHGRSTFGAESDRLIKRLRLFANAPDKAL